MLHLDKNSKLGTEWLKLSKVNKGLYHLAKELAAFSDRKFKKDMYVTSINRDDVKQAKIYEKEIKAGLLKEAPKTAHSVWAAVDFRTKHLSQTEINQCASFIKDNFDRHNKYKKIMGGDKYQKSCTVIYHEVPGWGPHFHVNYAGPVVMIVAHEGKVSALRCHDFGAQRS
jgi:hypothetical protein